MLPFKLPFASLFTGKDRPVQERSVLPAEERPQFKRQLIDLQERSIATLRSGTLFIASAYVNDASVVSFVAYCDRNGIAVDKEIVAAEEISRLLKEHSASNIVISEERNSVAEQTFHDITCTAANLGASDIHIMMTDAGTLIKERINGDLHHIKNWSLNTDDGTRLCSSIYMSLTGVAGKNYIPTIPQDAMIPSGNLHPSIRDKVNGIRVATSPTRNGTLMVLRLLYEHGVDGSLSDLGYSLEDIEIIERLKQHPHGITIVGGPTGSGKSTTLKIILNQIHKDCKGHRHILTVEDPPEQPMDGINQIPVTNADTVSERHDQFNRIVRSSLRLDPDTIMIGEIRDGVTAELAIRAAMTGHAVVSTLHVTTALGTVQRFLIEGVDIRLLSDPSVFCGAMSQRLVKVLCPKCRIPYADRDKHPGLIRYLRKSGMDKRLQKVVDAHPDATIYFKAGCEHCYGTGRNGRTVVAEIFENTYDSPVMDLLIANEWKKARTAWLQSGGKTMMMHAIDKMITGQIDPRAVEDALGPIFIE
jgi:general secretion pathway protein E